MRSHSERAVVVGSGPNGFAAAITLQRAGMQVTILERSKTLGGGMRTAELTLPGYRHDVCSAIHPLAKLSPFFRTLPLHEFGLEWIDPPVLAAHALDGGRAAVLLHDLDETVARSGVDGGRYKNIMSALMNAWPKIADSVLGPPLRLSAHPFAMARFGWRAMLPASLTTARLQTEEMKALMGGIAAHSVQPLDAAGTSAVIWTLMLAAHMGGWPIARGGSQAITDSLAGYFLSLGGNIETGHEVTSLDTLNDFGIIMLDVTPRQFIQMAGRRMPSAYKKALEKFRYGPGVFKVDWLLDGPVPFLSEDCRQAGTVHLGGTFTEVAHAEETIHKGRIPERPFVLLAQQSRFDRSRVPDEKEVVWGYCHVPHGCNVDMADAIEAQVERFAPGFRERVLARHVRNAGEMEQYNPNYVGGDIGGGAMSLRQIFARPVASASPYRTAIKNVYLCSSSTPPGGGVHGQCGYHAARQALSDCFPDHDLKVVS